MRFVQGEDHVRQQIENARLHEAVYGSGERGGEERTVDLPPRPPLPDQTEFPEPSPAPSNGHTDQQNPFFNFPYQKRYRYIPKVLRDFFPIRNQYYLIVCWLSFLLTSVAFGSIICWILIGFNSFKINPNSSSISRKIFIYAFMLYPLTIFLVSLGEMIRQTREYFAMSGHNSKKTSYNNVNAMEAGLKGEEYLRQAALKLGDPWVLFSGVTFQNMFGDIDAVLVGPKGVFALESKYWSGDITFNQVQNTWIQKKNYELNEILQKDPTNLVCDNAERLKQKIGAPVIPVLVFTAPRSRIFVENAPIDVVHLNGFLEYIKKQPDRLSPDEITRLADSIQSVMLVVAPEKSNYAVPETIPQTVKPQVTPLQSAPPPNVPPQAAAPHPTAPPTPPNPVPHVPEQSKRQSKMASNHSKKTGTINKAKSWWSHLSPKMRLLSCAGLVIILLAASLVIFTRRIQVCALNSNVNIRSTPAGEVVENLSPEECVVVYKTSADQEWLKILTPFNLSGKWITSHANAVDLDGDITSLPAE